MNLGFATRCAARIAERFGPFAERIQVAGSIRRRRPEVGDIDLVAIPKVSAGRDLFGAPQDPRNLLADEVRRVCTAEGWSLIRDGVEFSIFESRGVQVDLWYATQETFASIFLCRTGSKEHNVWLAMRALGRDSKWVPNRGLYVSGRPVPAENEEAIYAALGLPLLDPVTGRDEPAFRRYR